MFAWRGRDVVLEPVDASTWFDPPGRLAVIVHRGRFGLATVVDKDGLRALDVEWLTGEPKTRQVYMRRHQVRALVSDRRQLFEPSAAASSLVGKPVRDGLSGAEAGRVTSARVDDDRVVGTIECPSETVAAAIRRHPTSRLGLLVSAVALAGLAREDER